MTEEQQFIQKRYASLPNDLQQVVRSFVQKDQLTKVLTEYNLSEEQLSIIKEETLLILLGIDLVPNHESNLKSMLDIDQERIIEISRLIKKEIFSPVIELLKQFKGSQPDSAELSEHIPIRSTFPIKNHDLSLDDATSVQQRQQINKSRDTKNINKTKQSVIEVEEKYNSNPTEVNALNLKMAQKTLDNTQKRIQRQELMKNQISEYRVDLVKNETAVNQKSTQEKVQTEKMVTQDVLPQTKSPKEESPEKESGTDPKEHEEPKKPNQIPIDPYREPVE